MFFRTLSTVVLLAGCQYVSAQVRFEPQVIDDKISIGYGVAIGDVDGDGKPDILVADKKQVVWYRNGDWKKFVMAENLTKHDNVCIAARDINGDGKVEVAVGAQWNPGETSDDKESGAVFYLDRPADPQQQWKAVALNHEPTVHRMQWVRTGTGKFALVVLPLHGRGNQNGQGAGVNVLAYHVPENVDGNWRIDTLDNSLHMTHNFDVAENKNSTLLYVGGREGVVRIEMGAGGVAAKKMMKLERGVGEIRVSGQHKSKTFFATIEPMHGHNLVLYKDNFDSAVMLDSTLKEGHALAAADLSNDGKEEVVAGWRNPDKDGKVGIKMFYRKNEKDWAAQWVDENGMACEDLKVMDMNGDGRADIIASGRATGNVKIYWNRGANSK